MGENNSYKSALYVSEGVKQPPSVNPALQNIKRPKFTSKEYYKGILAGDRTMLSQAITMVESNLPKHAKQAQKIIEKCLPHTGKSIRIGITGVPGVGKSSFIDSMGKFITQKGLKLAVLAIDPSSQRSKGSILGDKTRMEALSTDPGAFIRPSPSAGSLGGVARKTRESILLCEAAGFNVIFVETVGVGQSEVAVSSMVDFFLLLMLAGAGDELQGIKRGIMELADMIAITKDDQGNEERASRAVSEYRSALHLFPASKSGWTPKVTTCSSRTNKGINEIWDTIMEYQELTLSNMYFVQNRQQQAHYWMIETINDKLKSHFYSNEKIEKKLSQLEVNVMNDKKSSFIAAQEILGYYFNTLKKNK